MEKTEQTQMTIDKQFFKNRADVMADIAKTGYWPTTYVSGKSPELPLHHHGVDLIGYVIEGATYLLDADAKPVEISAGDRLNIPKGAWHAEGACTDKVTYIVTVAEPIPFMEALQPLDPKGPMPTFNG